MDPSYDGRWLRHLQGPYSSTFWWFALPTKLPNRHRPICVFYFSMKSAVQTNTICPNDPEGIKRPITWDHVTCRCSWLGFALTWILKRRRGTSRTGGILAEGSGLKSERLLRSIALSSPAMQQETGQDRARLKDPKSWKNVHNFPRDTETHLFFAYILRIMPTRMTRPKTLFWWRFCQKLLLWRPLAPRRLIRLQWGSQGCHQSMIAGQHQPTNQLWQNKVVIPLGLFTFWQAISGRFGDFGGG